MGFKFWKMAVVVKGNKKDFEPNPLTEAIAEKRAKSDMKKKEKKHLKTKLWQ